MSQFPPTVSGTPVQFGGMMKPHRGGTVLALGIVGLVLNFGCGFGWILGIIAWVMANNDLKEMDAGVMDPSGRSNTSAGKICGIISVVLGAIGVIIFVLYMIFAVAVVGAAAASGGLQPQPTP